MRAQFALSMIFGAPAKRDELSRRSALCMGQPAAQASWHKG